MVYVRKLQQAGDGDISVVGGIETTRSLFIAGVIDALTLTIHPAVTPPKDGACSTSRSR